MLAETGILTTRAGARDRRVRSTHRPRRSTSTTLELYRRGRGFLLPDREASCSRASAPTSPAACTRRASRNDIDHTLFKLALKTAHRRAAGRARAHRWRRCSTSPSARQRHARSSPIPTASRRSRPPSATISPRSSRCLLRDIERLLQAAREIVDLCRMGAAAITTSGFPIDRARDRRAARLRRRCRRIPTAASRPSTTSTGDLCGARSSMFLHARTLRPGPATAGPSFEIGQLYVPNAFVQISSIMPQKRNPVPIEHMRLIGVARRRARAKPC